MFEIISGGGSSVKFATKNDALWLDPSTRKSADKSNELNNVVQLATSSRLLMPQLGDKPRLEGPGEYEVGPFSIKGFDLKSFDGSDVVTGYRLEINEVAIGVLGNGTVELSEDQFESLGMVDVLIIPVADGVVGPNPHQAATLVRRVEPKLIIPVGVAVDSTTQEPDSSALADLVKELGASTVTEGKIKIKSLGDLPSTMTVVLPE